MDCKTGITVVTWDAARGAKSYTVYARGSLGHNDECNSSDTNCDFPNLVCGQVYAITVLARHDSCVSLMSESINATTGTQMQMSWLTWNWLWNTSQCHRSYTNWLENGHKKHLEVHRKDTENPLYPLGPCPHSGLTTTMDCDTNTAVVSWTLGSDTLYYNVSASAFAISHEQICSSSSSSCNISNLHCGEGYRVSVSGQGQNCPSPAQDWNRINTGK